jgi:succinylglutamate desuccinylase
MSQEKILIIGGTHGNEQTGIRVVNQLIQNPISGIRAIKANPEAVEQNKRFIDTDLNRSFGSVDALSGNESDIVQKMSELRNLYDQASNTVIDFHNTSCDTKCAILCSNPNDRMVSLVRHFGFDKAVIFPSGGSFVGEFKNAEAFGLEFSNQDPISENIDYLIGKILSLRENNLQNINQAVTVYQFANRRILSLSQVEKIGRLSNFVELNDSQKEILRLSTLQKYLPVFYRCDAYEQNLLILVSPYERYCNL